MEKKSKWDSQIRSRRKIYEQYAIKSRRDICLNARIEKAASEKGISKNAYIIEAIERILTEDGYGKDRISEFTQESSLFQE